MRKDQLICLNHLSLATSNLRLLKTMITDELEEQDFVTRVDKIRYFIDVMDETLFYKYRDPHSYDVTPMDKLDHKIFREILLTFAELPVAREVLEEWIEGYKAKAEDLLYLPIIKWMGLSVEYYFKHIREAISLGFGARGLNFRTVLFQLMLNEYISDPTKCILTKIDHLSTGLDCLQYPIINSDVRLNDGSLTYVASEYKCKAKADAVANIGPCFRLQDLTPYCPLSPRITDEDKNIKELKKCISRNLNNQLIDPWKLFHASYWQVEVWDGFDGRDSNYIARYNHIEGISTYLLDEFHLYKVAPGFEETIYEVLDENTNLSDRQADKLLSKIEDGEWINMRMFEKYLGTDADIVNHLHKEAAELYGDPKPSF